MDTIKTKIEKWVPSKLNNNSLYFKCLSLYYRFSNTDFSPIFNSFSNRLYRLKYPFISSAITSGAMCFFGCITMSMCQLGYINNVDELFTFTACYILTDHYIDDITISDIKKQETINEIRNFINTPSNINIKSPLIKSISEHYINLINKLPNTTEYLKNIYKAEIETHKLQSNQGLNRETYLHLSEWKGGLFTNTIQSILELEITSAEYDLGACIQLVDDLLDVNDDISLNINTIVTYDYKTCDNLDGIFNYILDKIDNLDQKYNIFKLILTWGCVFAIHDNKEKYSNCIVELVEKEFNYFDENTTKKDIGKWMLDKLVDK